MNRWLVRRSYLLTRAVSDSLRRNARSAADLNCIASQFAYRAAVMYAETSGKRSAAMRFYAMADKLAGEVAEDEHSGC